MTEVNIREQVITKDDVTAKQIKCFVFTLNNYKKDEEECLKASLMKHCNYAVYGHEIGEKCGTPHLQGYAELGRSCTLRTIKKTINSRMFIAQRKGNQKQAIDYCLKDGIDIFQYGLPAKQGKRNDLASLRDGILAGKSKRQLIDDGHISCFAGLRAVDAMIGIYREPKQGKPFVTWIWGGSNTGKSHMGIELLKEAGCSIHIQHDNKWWDGYDGHTGVLLDDWRGIGTTFMQFLGFTDKWGYRGEIKGSSVAFIFDMLVVTSIFPPDKGPHLAMGEERFQLMRRIDRVIHLDTRLTDDSPNVILSDTWKKDEPKHQH